MTAIPSVARTEANNVDVEYLVEVHWAGQVRGGGGIGQILGATNCVDSLDCDLREAKFVQMVDEAQ